MLISFDSRVPTCFDWNILSFIRVWKPFSRPRYGKPFSCLEPLLLSAAARSVAGELRAMVAELRAALGATRARQRLATSTWWCGRPRANPANANVSQHRGKISVVEFERLLS